MSLKILEIGVNICLRMLTTADIAVTSWFSLILSIQYIQFCFCIIFRNLFGSNCLHQNFRILLLNTTNYIQQFFYCSYSQTVGNVLLVGTKFDRNRFDIISSYTLVYLLFPQCTRCNVRMCAVLSCRYK